MKCLNFDVVCKNITIINDDSDNSDAIAQLTYRAT